MNAVVEILYIAGAVLFILGIKRLSSPKTARGGNLLGSIGMLFAIAAATAKAPTLAARSLSKLAHASAPTIVMPEIAFAPDISGVWSVGGTLLMISTPTNIARTKR